MPRGDKRKYTGKQLRQAEHIEQGYEQQGLSEDEAERRAWATVNKIHKGGEKPGGGGYGKPEDHSPMRKGGAARQTTTASRTRSTKSTAKRTTARKKTAAKRTRAAAAPKKR